VENILSCSWTEHSPTKGISPAQLKRYDFYTAEHSKFMIDSSFFIKAVSVVIRAFTARKSLQYISTVGLLCDIIGLWLGLWLLAGVIAHLPFSLPSSFVLPSLEMSSSTYLSTSVQYVFYFSTICSLQVLSVHSRYSGLSEKSSLPKWLTLGTQIQKRVSDTIRSVFSTVSVVAI